MSNRVQAFLSSVHDGSTFHPGGAQVEAGMAIATARTDRRYNDTAAQLNALIDLYQCVRVALADRRPADGCLNRPAKP